jgi:hypothetical protein
VKLATLFPVATIGLALATPATAENLDVSVITVKQFTVDDHDGVVMSAGEDTYYDFLEITNKEDFAVSITKVEASLEIQRRCIIRDGNVLPLSLPSKFALEFTLRKGCGISGVSIGVENREQQYILAGPMLRLATPVFQAHFTRSNK